MSERVTEDFLTDLESKLAKIENDYRPTCESVNYGSGCPGATDASTAFWRAAVDCVPLLIAEVREHRAQSAGESHRVQVARLADALPINEEADRQVAAALKRATASHTSRKLTMPALTDDEVEALRWLREWSVPRLDVSSDKDASCEHCIKGHAALAILDKLTKDRP